MQNCGDKSVTDDLPLVEEDIKATQKRWDELRTRMDYRRRFLGEAIADFHQFYKSVLLVEEVLGQVESIVNVEFVFVLDPKDLQNKLSDVKVRERTLTKVDTAEKRFSAVRSPRF